MYHDFYGLTSDPFRLSPDHSFCLRHPSFSKAKAYMQFAVERAEGFVMITGRPGTGKTTLIDDLISDIDGHEVTTATLVSSQLEAEDMLLMVAYNFGLKPTGGHKATLLMELQGMFASMLVEGKRPLLIIDEAQGLPLSALEELRLLTNLRNQGQPMLQIFLVGQEKLRDLVMDPRMEQVHQRMIATCHLEPLDFRQTAAYVMHRMKTSGWQGRPRIRAHIFPVLYRFSRGTPRRINLFMGRLLLHGWLEEKEILSDRDANSVYEELKIEQLVSTHTDNLLQDGLPYEKQDIDESLLMPDQKIGAKLMAKEQIPSHPHSAAAADIRTQGQTGAVPADSAWTKPTSMSNPQASAPSPATLEEEKVSPQKRKRFWGWFG